LITSSAVVPWSSNSHGPPSCWQVIIFMHAPSSRSRRCRYPASLRTLAHRALLRSCLISRRPATANAARPAPRAPRGRHDRADAGADLQRARSSAMARPSGRRATSWAEHRARTALDRPGGAQGHQGNRRTERRLRANEIVGGLRARSSLSDRRSTCGHHATQSPGLTACNSIR
jgi:hypothetical protein